MRILFIFRNPSHGIRIYVVRLLFVKLLKPLSLPYISPVLVRLLVFAKGQRYRCLGAVQAGDVTVFWSEAVRDAFVWNEIMDLYFKVGQKEDETCGI